MAFGVEEIPNKLPYVETKGIKFGEVGPYPKYKYHADHAPQGELVATAEDEESYGEGWHDSPAVFAGSHAPSQAELKAAARAKRGDTAEPVARRGPGRPKSAE